MMEPAAVDRKWSNATGVSAETVSFLTTFLKGSDSGGSNQSYIDCDGPVGFNPADFTADPTNST
jgi:hypothetical protein